MRYKIQQDRCPGLATQGARRHSTTLDQDLAASAGRRAGSVSRFGQRALHAWLEPLLSALFREAVELTDARPGDTGLPRGEHGSTLGRLGRLPTRARLIQLGQRLRLRAIARLLPRHAPNRIHNTPASTRG